jgi:hypothetical protein
MAGTCTPASRSANVFANLGYGVLVASRPGYGRTPGDRRPFVLGAEYRTVQIMLAAND